MSTFLFTAIIVTGAILIYGVFIEPNWIEIRRVQIKNYRLQHTIGHRDLNPDLVFITGDLVPFKKGFEPVANFLNKLRAKEGIWVALGNSDYSNENGLSILCHELNSKKLKTGGAIHIFRNSHETIPLPQPANQSINCIDQSEHNGRLTIVGLDDPVTHRDNLAAALDGVPEESAKILLTHFQHFTINSKINEHFKSVDLVLSGHTHGGQIVILKYLPSFINYLYFKRQCDKENNRPIKANHRRVPPVFKGLYQQGLTVGYINCGLGTSYLPIRLGVRPEITSLEFIA